MYRKNYKNIAIGLAAIALIGLCQYPMPILANGEADVGKQLFMFNVTFDVSIWAAIAILLQLCTNTFPFTALRRSFRREYHGYRARSVN